MRSTGKGLILGHSGDSGPRPAPESLEMSCGGGYPSVPRAAPKGHGGGEPADRPGPIELCQCLQSGVVLGRFPTWQMLCGLGRSFSLRGKLNSSKMGG